MRRLSQWIAKRISKWLVKDGPAPTTPLCDFNRLCYELRPGDVLLVEGRSRVSEVIKLITQSTWTHAALYIGRLHDIQDPKLRLRVADAYQGDPNDQLMIEALLDEGTIVAPVIKYKKDHLRICRPTGLSPNDAHRVNGYAIRHIGVDYNIRQLLDLARFLFPWTFLPRRWRSSLFQHNAGGPTRTVCSCLLAEAYSQVDFPILPFIDRGEDGNVRFFKRNPRLFTPKDFDHSPYFDIIKYPFLGLDDLGIYRRLPWCDKENHYNDDAEISAREDDNCNCTEQEALHVLKPVARQGGRKSNNRQDDDPSVARSA